MYRIALQTAAATTSKPATFQFLTVGGGTDPWETADEREGLKRFCSELDNYPRSLLSLVNMIDIKCHCEDESNVDQIVEFGATTLKVVKNDGTDFIAKIDLGTTLSDYSVVAVNDDSTVKAKASLEALGLSNVIITKEGVTASNATGKAVSGSAYMNEGIWRLYSETARKDNYISSAFSLSSEVTGDHTGI